MNNESQLYQQLNQGLGSLHLILSEATKDKILAYIKLLEKWNRVYNLTAIENPQEILVEHIFDSLAIAPYLYGQRILDVGTGAGLPGIPLALAFPERRFVLLDSIGKKIRFLTQVIAELALTNVQVLQTRVEAFFPEQCFNSVVVRAVGTIKDIIAKSEHLLCSDGQFLLMKGVYPEAELEGINNVKVYPLKVPGMDKQRHLICIQRKKS